MKRRDFLTMKRSETATLSPLKKASLILSGLEPYTGPWDRRRVAHLLRRSMFGAKIEDLNYFLGKNLEQSISELLIESAVPNPPVNDYNSVDVEDPDVLFGETWIDALPNGDVEGNRIGSLKVWWLNNIINQEKNLTEKMILFWHNHIPTQFYDVFTARWSFYYLRTIRTHALGNFKELVKAMTLDPSMLHYLNGQFNSAGVPDENYARELQELFCLGKGPDSNYTEEDVQAMARVLTGWRVNYNDLESIYFNDAEHDSDDKLLSSFYGNAVITGRSGQAGQNELDDLLDVIFSNNETALFVCRKLYRFFVSDLIDETVEQNVITPLGAIFRDNNYEIVPVLEALFSSQHFFDALTLGDSLKSSLDFVIGGFREMEMAFPDENELSDKYNIGLTLNFVGALIQQDIGDPPNVAGWPAYYQIPLFHKSWINTDTLPKRIQFSDYFLFAGISTDTFVSIMDVVKVVEQFQNGEDPNAVIDEAVEWLFGIDISAKVKIVLKSILLSGQTTDSYWTNAWFDYLGDPTDEMAYQVVLSRLQGFFYYLLHLEEYQLS